MTRDDNSIVLSLGPCNIFLSALLSCLTALATQDLKVVKEKDGKGGS